MFQSTALYFMALAAAGTIVNGQGLPQDRSFSANNLPHTWRNGQYGYNDCTNVNAGPSATGNNNCQTLWFNSVEDFCLWGPPQTGNVGATEEENVAYCTLNNHGTRVMPAGTIKGAHFVQTSKYIQITGMGDFTKINIRKGDEGGELDPYGATNQGNPVGGLVYTTAYGGAQQVHVWTNFMSDNQFCLRACFGSDAAEYCNHIYDLQGCEWNMPGNYGNGVYEQCAGEPDLPMGVYGGSTWYQPAKGQHTTTPDPHPAAPSSNCRKFNTVGAGAAAAAPAPTPTSKAKSGKGKAKTTTTTKTKKTGKKSGKKTKKSTVKSTHKARHNKRSLGRRISAK